MLIRSLAREVSTLIRIDNLLNLNANKLLVNALVKHLARVPNKEIREDIIYMLKNNS